MVVVGRPELVIESKLEHPSFMGAALPISQAIHSRESGKDDCPTDV
jgi:hypothetical protein